ncbi:glycosyltransferase family 39 protein [Sulfurovum sp. zt1-1]|uniref:Glycosyltransferase family 39 protein n=1 Tax=Sulfurovum zhangzhouensis TaxID=3019067 RepID=A0ABT7QYK2_9BACT|nr:glycosyltransferase family 39 protein [Sulfurovum zhangzhouensis]MDM5271846.1 glycosyltransferase family 39 protein [Sulfurovum zhangzhouensis]
MNNYQSVRQNALIAFVVILLVTLIGIYFRPIMIIDETRYVSVAWEMWDKGSFLVPLLNGEPYHHKPPLIFWLFNLDWLIFGVNDISIRLIPMLFGLGTLAIVYKIYLALWNDDQEGAAQSIVVTAGTVVFAFYNSLIMFDVILTFFVLLGIYHIIKATQNPSRYHFIMIAVAFGLGVLTKGPVILVHLLTFMVFSFYFMKNRLSKDFYIKLVLSFFGGVLIALAWAIPAGIAGGEEYRYAIFFGQTANRMVNSFAHQRPLWWYLVLVPLLTFPWSLYKPFYTSIKKTVFDQQLKVLVGWLLATIVIFSLISGKQVHYLMPEIAAFSLVFTRLLTSSASSQQISSKMVGYSYILYGVVLVALPFILPKTKADMTFEPDIVAFLIAAALICMAGIYLIRKKFSSQQKMITLVSLSTVLVVFVTHLPIHNFLSQLDMSRFSKSIAILQEKGIPVLHYKKYHDQYQFAGRLHQPLIVVYDNKEIDNYIQKNPNAMFITYEKQKNMQKVNQDLIIEKTDFKGKYALLIKAKDYKNLYKVSSTK